MNNDYNYLNGLSPQAQEVIINKIDNGEINIYQSIMAVLGSRHHKEQLKDCETEKRRYMKGKKEKVLYQILASLFLMKYSILFMLSILTDFIILKISL